MKRALFYFCLAFGVAGCGGGESEETMSLEEFQRDLIFESTADHPRIHAKLDRDQFEAPLPSSMAVMGDSISRAAMAGFQRLDASKLWFHLNLVRIGIRAIFVNNKAADMPELSWSTGLGVKKLKRVRRGKRWVTRTEKKYPVASHALRIQNALEKGHRFKVLNAAESGAESDDLETQMDKILEWSDKELGQAVPDYVTLLMGANDICDGFGEENGEIVEKMESKAEYKKRVEAVVEGLLSEGVDNRILLLELPKIESIYQVNLGAELPLVGPAIAAITERLFGFGEIQTCGEFWETAGSLCEGLLQEKDPQRRAAMAERIEDYNDALEEIADEKSFIYGDRVRAASDLRGQNFNSNDTAVDCFHPSVKGQNRIAEESWKSTWWD